MLRTTATTWQSKEELENLKERIPESRRHAPVSSTMIENPVTLSPDLEANEGMQHIHGHSHGAYPLVDEEGKVVGMIRRSQLFEWFKNLQPGQTHRIATAPTTAVPMVSPETPVDVVLEQMVRSGTTRALVIDGEQKLLGITTLADILLKKP
jgi:CBS domain-containing protein